MQSTVRTTGHKSTRRVFFHAIGALSPLVPGIFIYIYHHDIASIRSSNAVLLFLRNVTLNTLPDILWTTSFFCVLNLFIDRAIISYVIVSALTITFEAMQSLSIINGTGDFWDAFCPIFILGLFVIFTYLKRRY